MYTSPEIASVGLTEDEAAQAGIPVSVGKFPDVCQRKSPQISREEKRLYQNHRRSRHQGGAGSPDDVRQGPRGMIGEMATAAANKLTVPQLLLGMRPIPPTMRQWERRWRSFEGGSIHTVPRQAPGKLKSRQ